MHWLVFHPCPTLRRRLQGKKFDVSQDRSATQVWFKLRGHDECLDRLQTRRAMKLLARCIQAEHAQQTMDFSRFRPSKLRATTQGVFPADPESPTGRLGRRRPRQLDLITQPLVQL